MKNILKKVSAVALSFALLGTGTVISSNTTTFQSTNTLVAEANSAYTYGYCTILTRTMKSYDWHVQGVYKEYYYGRYTGYCRVDYRKDNGKWHSEWVPTPEYRAK